ncbi:MAG: response regulator [Bacteroidota bacterium]
MIHNPTLYIDPKTPAKILLVEDNPVNQKIASHFLVKWGYQVTVANDGKEAVNLISNKDFELVLMDLQMPEMDGVEATQQIRSMGDSYFKSVPIIAFSASALSETKEKAEQLGMNDFLAKPLNPEEMHRKVNWYIMDASSNDYRKLHINFNAYAECDDEFKLEVIGLMISNIRELQQAAYSAQHTNDIQRYLDIAHKIQSTLSLLCDEEFSTLIEEIRGMAIASVIQADKVNKLTRIGESLVKSLEKETELYRAAS